MRCLQRVAIRAEDPEVLDAVVGLVAIDMIELERESPVGRALRPSTQLAVRWLDTCRDEAELEPMTGGPPSSNQHLQQRNRGRTKP